jgi:hypothetical protein
MDGSWSFADRFEPPPLRPSRGSGSQRKSAKARNLLEFGHVIGSLAYSFSAPPSASQTPAR